MDLYHLQTLLRSDMKEVSVLNPNGTKSLALSKFKADLFLQTALLGTGRTMSPLALVENPRYINQYQQYLLQLTTQVSKKVSQIAHRYSDIKFISKWSEINEDTYRDYNNYSNLLKQIETDIKNINLSDWEVTSSISELDNELSRLKLLLTDLTALSHTAKFLDGQNNLEDELYDDRLAELVKIVDTHTQSLRDHKQYKAMIFLDRAEKYIKSPDRKWNTGFQWNKHTLEGTDIAIPQHVAKQLAEIKAAKMDGDYVKHMNAFVDIGQKQIKSRLRFFSSKSSLQHSSLFANKHKMDQQDVIKSLEETFLTSSNAHY